MGSRESTVDDPESVKQRVTFMEVSEPGGPIGSKGRFERGEEEMPDKAKLMDSVRRDGRAGEDVSSGFNCVGAEFRITFAKSIGVNRTKAKFTLLSRQEVVKEFSAKGL